MNRNSIQNFEPFDNLDLYFGVCAVQVNLCQKLFFLQNMGRTCCVQKLFWMSDTISVHNMFSPGLSLEFSCIEQSAVILWVSWCKNKSFWQRFTCTAMNWLSLQTNYCLQIQTTDHLLKIALMNPNSTNGKQETEKTMTMIILIPLYMCSNESFSPLHLYVCTQWFENWSFQKISISMSLKSYSSMNFAIFTTFAQLSPRLKTFLEGWSLVLGIKEGLVECASATVCVKSVVILNMLLTPQFNFKSPCIWIYQVTYILTYSSSCKEGLLSRILSQGLLKFVYDEF